MEKRTVLMTVDTKLQTWFEGPVIMVPYTYFYILYARLAVANLSCCTKTRMPLRYLYGTVRYRFVYSYKVSSVVDADPVPSYSKTFLTFLGGMGRC